MREKVLRDPWVVVMAAETQVALLVDIDSQRVPSWDHHPHTDVKLAIEDEHRIFNVLLYHPRLLCVSVLLTICRLRVVVHVVLRVRSLWIRRRGEAIGGRDLGRCINLSILENLLEILE